MGKILKYVSDKALYKCGGSTCHHCESEDKPIYDFYGEIIDPQKAKDPELAMEEPDISEVCADCINCGNLRRTDSEYMENTINKYSTDKAYSKEQLNYLPNIPLFLQGSDWPMCCGEWCEFQGSPESYEESKLIPNEYKYWHHGPEAWAYKFELLPENLREVSLFLCKKCNSKLFTWQFT